MRGYTGSQEAAQWSKGGARPVLEVLGWSLVTLEGLYVGFQEAARSWYLSPASIGGPGVPNTHISI